MNDGSIGGPDEHWSVVINVYDCDDQVCGAPHGRTPLVCGNHSEVETFRRLKQTARTHQPGVWIQGERICSDRERSGTNYRQRYLTLKVQAFSKLSLPYYLYILEHICVYNDIFC